MKGSKGTKEGKVAGAGLKRQPSLLFSSGRSYPQNKEVLRTPEGA